MGQPIKGIEMKKIIILLCSVIVQYTAFAQEPTWVNVQAHRQISRYESRELSENKLLAEARLLAIQKGTGITVRSVEAMTTRESSTATESNERDSKWFEEYLQYSRQETAGRIIKEDSPVFNEVERNGDTWLQIDLRALVAIDSGNIDPGFIATLRTRQPAYREGDTIRIELESSKNAKLYLFNVSTDGKCTLIWPNLIEHDNHLTAGVKTMIPQNTERYAMVAELIKNKMQSVNGTANNFSQELLFALLYRGEDSVFDPATAFAREYSLSELNQRLISIPRSQRYEIMATFSITE
jgi:hypothetical protein